MKRFFLALVAAAAMMAGTAAWAQSGTPENPSQGQPQQQEGRHRRHGKRNGQAMFDRMAQQLNLTEQQKSQIQPILQAQHQQMGALRSDTSLTAEQKRQRAKQIREQTHSQIQAILTPEQQKQLEEMHQKHHRHGGKPGGAPNQGPGNF